MAVNIQRPRNLPQVNDFTDNVYLFAVYHDDHQNVRSYKIKAFRTIIGSTQFQMRQFYERQGNTPVFYYNITRVLFMGDVHRRGISGTDASELEAQFFPRQAGMGFHVYISGAGNLMNLLLAGNRVSRTQFAVRWQTDVYDVFPRFKQLANQTTGQHRLYVAIKVQIINTVKGNRDGGRCGYTYVGGMYMWSEHSVLSGRLNQYLPILDTFLPHFGVYVCANAKLMFFDTCRKCQYAVNNPKFHHNRTLIQSGAFLIIEGFLCFQFEEYNDNIYTGVDLEELGILPQEMITGKQYPLFFLRGNAGNASIAWGLGPIEDRREKEHWILCVPENGQFEAIEEYADGVEEVLHYQSQTPEPWSHHVIRDPQTIYNRPQTFTRYRAPQQCLQRIAERNRQNVPLINWTNVHNNPPQPPDPIPFTPVPQFRESHHTVVNLALGTPVRIPRVYHIGGHQDFNHPNCRYSRYFNVNRFWYIRVSGNKNPVLELHYEPLETVPDHLKYEPVYRYFARDNVGRDYNLYSYTHNRQNRNEDEYVVYFYWRSPLNYIMQRVDNF